ncbi:MAG: site-2 protease family protein [Chloroflexi bacterium]|nr:site-2 protease family protein [Chloroflexota bacterium]MCI0578744.1 site-2 protease family protein [Chloroflexota bacterium]MCI0643971.1 site-2 protease family protein [Chloroflexota bacterium]MCI0732030.1 site-2 protease family protein [Chloroflexota bacterium]
MQGYYTISTPDPLQQTTNVLRAELMGLFQVNNVATRGRGRVISFGGRLLYDADASYDEIQRRFRAHGYTPMLRREKGEDVLLAMEGLISRARTGNPLVNLLLFVVTVFTTLEAGAKMAGESALPHLLTRAWPEVFQTLQIGAPFAVALLGILGVHELGHYVAARAHGVRATLPYFIPMPVGGLGTMGAFIAIKSPMKNRKVLFDIGLAGPVAGFLVAVPLMIVGLTLSSVQVPFFARGLTLNNLGSSILVDALVKTFAEVPPGGTLSLHPIFFAAWLGFFLTGINLLPVGQLDGGHVSYALLGRYAHWLGMAVFALLLAAGSALSYNWYIWAFFILFGGLRHPPPMNDITGVGPLRVLIGLLAVVLFFLILVPQPFR